MLLNSILVNPNKEIVNNDVDYKSISILVTQKKGILVLSKGGASFKQNIIMVTYKRLILYLNILVNKLKQAPHRLQVNKSTRKIIKTYILQYLYKNHYKHLQLKIYYLSNEISSS